jgi:hypothetical protein
MDGPGEDILGENGELLDFMPYLSRDSRDGEFGTRVCRRCSKTESRWPLTYERPILSGKLKSM